MRKMKKKKNENCSYIFRSRKLTKQKYIMRDISFTEEEIQEILGKINEHAAAKPALEMQNF